jgi:hypothetical protein
VSNGEHLWRPHLESYLAVREAMGHSVRAERKLLGEFLDFADQKGGAGPIRAEWALDWACMLSPRRGVGGQAGRLSVVRNRLTYLRAFIAETEVPHHGLLRGPNRRKPYLFSADEIRCMLTGSHDGTRPAKLITSTSDFRARKESRTLRSITQEYSVPALRQSNTIQPTELQNMAVNYLLRSNWR